MGTSLVQFKESLSLASSLIKLEKKYPQVPNTLEQPYVKGLRGGATVLMVAAFEFFIRKLFEDNISTLNTNPPSIDINKLPEKLLEKNVFHSLKRSSEGPQFGNKPPLAQRIKDTLAMCDLLMNDHINAKAFSETGSNPNSDRVKDKFKEIGVDDIFGKIKPTFEIKWKQRVAATFIKDTLDKIVSDRHVVAHTADTLNITRQSLNDSIRFLTVLSTLLEKELLKQIKLLAKTAKK